MEVMRGFSFERWRPRVVVLENLRNDKAYHDHMERNRYRFVRGLHLNEIWELLPEKE